MTRYESITLIPMLPPFCVISLSQRVSMALQEYRKLPALKEIYFLKLGRFPPSPERLGSVFYPWEHKGVERQKGEQVRTSPLLLYSPVPEGET